MRLSCSKVLPRWATASSTVHGMSVCCREGRVHAESGDAWYVMDHPDRKQFDLNERTVASGLTGRFRLLTYVYVRMYLVGRLRECITRRPRVGTESSNEANCKKLGGTHSKCGERGRTDGMAIVLSI